MYIYTGSKYTYILCISIYASEGVGEVKSAHHRRAAVEDQLLGGQESQSARPFDTLAGQRLHPHTNDWLLDDVEAAASHLYDPPSPESRKIQIYTLIYTHIHLYTRIHIHINDIYTHTETK